MVRWGVEEGWVWCPGEERGRDRCVTSEEVRLGRLASELADLHWPHASRGAALSGRGGPLRGRAKGEVLGGQGLSLLIDLRLSLGTAWGEAAR